MKFSKLVDWPAWPTRWYWRVMKWDHEHDWLPYDAGYVLCRRCGLFEPVDHRQ